MEHISETLDPELQKIVVQLRNKLLRQQQNAESTRKHIQVLTSKHAAMFDTKK